MIRIYCLVDPRNDKPFYVGATNGPLNKRLSGHIKAAKDYRLSPWLQMYPPISSKKAALIMDILASNTKPSIRELIIIPKIATNDYEKFFYEMFETQGFKMLQLKSAFYYYEAKTNSRFSGHEYQQVAPISHFNNNNTLK